MKLSEIRGDAVFDVIADIIEPVANIAEDKDAMKLFERKECPEGMEPREFMAKRIKGAAPSLLRGHKADLVAIFAALNMQTREEYEEGLTMQRLFVDLFEMFTDEELLSFLS